MARCKVDCVSIISGTNREKWDYVRGLYFDSYGNEIRDPSDPARIAEEAAMTALFTKEETAWQAKSPNAPFEYWLQWKYERGSESYGNLPQHKASFKIDCDGNQIIGHSYAPCPYSTESTDLRSEQMLGSVPTKVTHTAGGVIYYMETAYQGKWGFRCTYDGCPYYLTNGVRYFYC